MDNERAVIFGKNVERLRKERGLSREDLAKLVGVAGSTYGCYANGTREPKFKTLFALAKNLNCSITELLGDNPEAENFAVWKHRFERSLYLAMWAGFKPSYSSEGKVTLELQIATDAGIETQALDFADPISFIESVEVAENHALYHELTFKDAFMHFYNTGQLPLKLIYKKAIPFKRIFTSP